jgi:hypothetical protein
MSDVINGISVGGKFTKIRSGIKIKLLRGNVIPLFLKKATNGIYVTHETEYTKIDLYRYSNHALFAMVNSENGKIIYKENGYLKDYEGTEPLTEPWDFFYRLDVNNGNKIRSYNTKYIQWEWLSASTNNLVTLKNNQNWSLSIPQEHIIDRFYAPPIEQNASIGAGNAFGKSIGNCGTVNVVYKEPLPRVAGVCFDKCKSNLDCSFIRMGPNDSCELLSSADECTVQLDNEIQDFSLSDTDTKIKNENRAKVLLDANNYPGVNRKISNFKGNSTLGNIISSTVDDKNLDTCAGNCYDDPECNFIAFNKSASGNVCSLGNSLNTDARGKVSMYNAPFVYEINNEDRQQTAILRTEAATLVKDAPGLSLSEYNDISGSKSNSANTFDTCRDACLDDSECNYFSIPAYTNKCTLGSGIGTTKSNLSDNQLNYAVSPELRVSFNQQKEINSKNHKSDYIGPYSCGGTGIVTENVDNTMDCEIECFEDDECKGFTYDSKNKSCSRFNACGEVTEFSAGKYAFRIDNQLREEQTKINLERNIAIQENTVRSEFAGTDPNVEYLGARECTKNSFKTIVVTNRDICKSECEKNQFCKIYSVTGESCRLFASSCADGQQVRLGSDLFQVKNSYRENLNTDINNLALKRSMEKIYNNENSTFEGFNSCGSFKTIAMPSVELTGTCTGSDVYDFQSRETCIEKCSDDKQCKYYSYNGITNICTVHKNCDLTGTTDTVFPRIDSRRSKCHDACLEDMKCDYYSLDKNGCNFHTASACVIKNEKKEDVLFKINVSVRDKKTIQILKNLNDIQGLELIRQKQEFNSQIETINVKNKKIIADLNKSHDSELLTINAEHLAALESVKSEHIEKLSVLKIEHERQVTVLSEKLADSAELIVQMNITHENAIENLRSSQSLAIANLLTQQSDKIIKMENDHSLELELNIVNHKKEVDALNVKISSLSSNVTQLETSALASEALAEISRVEIKKATERGIVLKGTIDTLKSESNNLVSKLEITNENLKISNDNIIILQKELQVAENTNTSNMDIQTKLTAAIVENGIQKGTVANIKNTLTIKNARVVSLESDVVSLESDVVSLESDVVNLELKVKNSADVNKSLSDSLADADNTKITLKNELDILKSGLTDTEKSAQDVRVELATVKEQVKTLQQQDKLNSEELIKAVTLQTELEGKEILLNEAKNILQQDLDESESEIMELEEKIINLKNVNDIELNKFKDEAETIIKNNLDILAVNTKLSLDITAAQSKMEISNSAVKLLEQDAETLEKLNVDLQARLDESFRSLTSIREKVAELESSNNKEELDMLVISAAKEVDIANEMKVTALQELNTLKIKLASYTEKLVDANVTLKKVETTETDEESYFESFTNYFYSFFE